MKSLLLVVSLFAMATQAIADIKYLTPQDVSELRERCRAHRYCTPKRIVTRSTVQGGRAGNSGRIILQKLEFRESYGNLTFFVYPGRNLSGCIRVNFAHERGQQQGGGSARCRSGVTRQEFSVDRRRRTRRGNGRNYVNSGAPSTGGRHYIRNIRSSNRSSDGRQYPNGR